MWIDVRLCMILYQMQAAGLRCKLAVSSYPGVLGTMFTTPRMRSRLRTLRIQIPHSPVLPERSSICHQLQDRAVHGAHLDALWSGAEPLTIRWGILERGP